MASLAFDLDGTLITAEAKQSFALRAVAARFGVTIDCAALWRKKREGDSNYKALVDSGVDEGKAEIIATAWRREIETPFWLSLDVPFADCFECLGRVRKAGYESILITARSNEYMMRQQLLQLGLEGYFTSVFCVDPGRSAQEKSAVLKGQDVKGFFGDTEADFAAAQAAGVAFFAVGTGQRSEGFLKRAGLADVSASLGHAVEKFFSL